MTRFTAAENKTKALLEVEAAKMNYLDYRVEKKRYWGFA
jgi:hypothetical protein